MPGNCAASDGGDKTFNMQDLCDLLLRESSRTQTMFKSAVKVEEGFDGLAFDCLDIFGSWCPWRVRSRIYHGR